MMLKTQFIFCWICNRRRMKKYHGLPATLCICVTFAILCVAILNVFSAVTRVYSSRALVISYNITQSETKHQRTYGNIQKTLHYINNMEAACYWTLIRVRRTLTSYTIYPIQMLILTKRNMPERKRFCISMTMKKNRMI